MLHILINSDSRVCLYIVLFFLEISIPAYLKSSEVKFLCYINGIQLANFRLLIDRTSLIYLKVRLKVLASVIFCLRNLFYFFVFLPFIITVIISQVEVNSCDYCFESIFRLNFAAYKFWNFFKFHHIDAIQ